MEKIYSNINLNDIKYKPDYIKSFKNNNITEDIYHVLEAFANTTPGSHNLIVYSDIRILRRIYPFYIKSLLKNDEIVLILTYYDHPSLIRQMLLNGDDKQDNVLDLEGFINDGSLVIVDSLKSYFNLNRKNELDKDNTLNFLSLVNISLYRGVKNNKNGITILSDMGSFFHLGSVPYKNNNNNFNDWITNRILKYERSIPSSYKGLELKEFCLYHQKDYESYITSTHQKVHSVDCHGSSVMIIDNNSNRNDNYRN